MVGYIVTDTGRKVVSKCTRPAPTSSVDAGRVCAPFVIIKKKETRRARGPTPPIRPPVDEETILKGEVVADPDGAIGSLGRRISDRRLRCRHQRVADFARRGARVLRENVALASRTALRSVNDTSV